MSQQFEHHQISVSLHHNGLITVRHAWIDGPTRKLVTEQLTSPPPVESGPWSWEEALLLAASELLERRVALEADVPW